jgi:hypothetical protein
VEDCASEGDYRWFELKKGVNFNDMPAFPLDDFIREVPSRVRGIVAAVYLAKIVDVLQGRVEYDLPKFPIANHKTGSRVFDALKVASLLDDPAKGDPAHTPIGEAGSDSSNGPGEVVG